MTKHPYLNPTGDPKKEAFWDKAATDFHKRVTEAQERVRRTLEAEAQGVVRPPSEYWDTRRKLRERKDSE